DLAKAGPPAISGPNTLVLRFGPGYNSAQEHCQAPAKVARVEEALRKVTGQPCVFRIESNAAQASGAAAGAAEPEENTQSRYRRQRAEALKEPLVKRAVEVLGAQLLDVDEGFGVAASPVPERIEAAETEEA